MLSRADRPRAAGEWLLRIVVVAILGWYLVHVLWARSHGAAETVASAELSPALARWTTTSTPARVHVVLAHPPAGLYRDWLAALAGAGTAVEWSGPSLLPTAIAVDPRPDPARDADVAVAAPPGAMVRVLDTLGGLDSARATAAGIRVHLPKPRRTVDAAVGPVRARAVSPDSLRLGRLLVVGGAGWETKFTVAALEERGWTVDAQIAVSPKDDVRQGKVAELDTARYAAVIAIDTIAARYGDRIASFVRTGGGLVLWAPAARTRALAPLAAGGSGAPIEASDEPPSDSLPRSALALVPITALAPDAVVLERRGEHTAVAARRIGPGRVIETGYLDTWRWRMAGGDEAPEHHRAWLATLVARVAYAGRVPLPPPPTDAAPLATLVDKLGPAASPLQAGAGGDPAALARWVFGLLCGALLLEWASRRTRGVK
jgi:hypothetical protein